MGSFDHALAQTEAVMFKEGTSESGAAFPVEV